MGPSFMTRTRSTSSPPSSAGRRAAEIAAEAAVHAARAAEAAAVAAAVASTDPGPQSSASTSVDAVQWPPAPNEAGDRFWYAREYPGLVDGVYTAIALTNRGVNPSKPAATGLLQGWKTETPVLRRAYLTGVDCSIIHWR